MKEKIAILSVVANIVLAGTKIFVGIISNSSAVLAEGVHSFMDIFSSAVGYAGIKISQKPADEEHPYGHYKFEIVAGSVITVILFVTGVGIVYEAYTSFLNPSIIAFGYLGFIVMLFSAVVNEVMARVKIHYGKKENSLALLSDGIHSRVDVYTSLAVFVGLFLTKYWVHADAVLALLIGLYIIKESFSLGKEAADSLLDVSAGEEVEEHIKAIGKKEHVEIESLKTQKKGSVITANLEVTLPNTLSVKEATKISEDLRKCLMEEIDSLAYVAIQIQSLELETDFYKPEIGKGFGWQRRGVFKKNKDGQEGKGPGGLCVCVKCGYVIPHEHGRSCSSLQCPDCALSLERKDM